MVVVACDGNGSKEPGGKHMTDGPPTQRDARDTARYIQRMAKELRTMAVESNLGFLAYLLSMVEDDAAATARQPNDK